MIRTASAEDAGVIARLCGQLGYPATGEQIRHRMREILGRDDHAVVVSERGSTLVGWAHVSVRHLVESNPCAEICGFVVEEAHRGQGVGTELLQAIEDWARSQGRDTIRVRSNTLSEDAHRFYEGRGYRCSKRQAIFAKILR